MSESRATVPMMRIERVALNRELAERSRYLSELSALVRIPSVSAQPRHAGEVHRCAHWLARRLRAVGLDQVRVHATAGHPIVLGSWRGAPGRPTVLIYGHYDVQPPDPLSAWHTPPFTPVVRGDHLYGRGASDDKGQLLAHIAAIESCLRSTSRLPVNVICLFEGEEEIGSPHLSRFLASHRNALHADAVVVSDTRMLGPCRPALTYALRGSLALELEVRGPGRDLHSGRSGGAVYNPIQALSEIIAVLHDRHGRIAIPGIYGQVRTWSAAERARMAAYGPSDQEIARETGVTLDWGEPGYTAYERTTIRPALTLNGISGGYQGPGGKSVIPSRATAKLSFRLVPDQCPDEVWQMFTCHLARISPPGVRVVARRGHSSVPVLLDRDNRVMRAAERAYCQAFGARPVYLRSGGSIPAVAMLQHELRVPVALMGFGLPGDGAHAPNENLHLPTFFRSISACIAFLHAFGADTGERSAALSTSRLV